MDAKGIEGNGAHDKDPSHFINAKGATAKVLSLMKKDEKEEDNGVGDGGGGGGGEEAAAVNDGEMSVAGNDGKTVPSHTSETSSSSSSAPPPPKLTPSFVIGKNSSNASNPAHYSNNTHAMSFTSTSVSLQTRNVAAAFSEEDHMFRSLPPVSMGFVSISTNLGDINLVSCFICILAFHHPLRVNHHPPIYIYTYSNSIAAMLLVHVSISSNWPNVDFITASPFTDPLKTS